MRIHHPWAGSAAAGSTAGADSRVCEPHPSSGHSPPPRTGARQTPARGRATADSTPARAAPPRPSPDSAAFRLQALQCWLSLTAFQHPRVRGVSPDTRVPSGAVWTPMSGAWFKRLFPRPSADAARERRQGRRRTRAVPGPTLNAPYSLDPHCFPVQRWGRFHPSRVRCRCRALVDGERRRDGRVAGRGERGNCGYLRIRHRRRAVRARLRSVSRTEGTRVRAARHHPVHRSYHRP